MSTKAERLLQHLEVWITLVGRGRVWQQLRMWSDFRLRQLGYSPALVRKGPAYWPWRSDSSVGAECQNFGGSKSTAAEPEAPRKAA